MTQSLPNPAPRADLLVQPMRHADPAQVAPHAHADLLQLVLATEGTCTLDLDDIRREVSAPCLIAIPGGTVHGFAVTPGGEGWLALIRHHRVLEAVMTLRVGVAQLLARPYVVDLADNPAQVARLAGLLVLLHEESVAPQDGQALCLDALQRLLLVHLSRVIGKSRAHGDPQVSGDHALFLEFRAAIERRFARTRQVADYARALGTTPARLNALSHRYASRSAKQVVMDRVIDEARRRLRFSGENAADVALSLGFSDPSYFLRMFRKHTGSTPGQFRAPPSNLNLKFVTQSTVPATRKSDSEPILSEISKPSTSHIIDNKEVYHQNLSTPGHFHDIDDSASRSSQNLLELVARLATIPHNLPNLDFHLTPMENRAWSPLPVRTTLTGNSLREGSTLPKAAPILAWQT